jgi:hypothetical protein
MEKANAYQSMHIVCTDRTCLFERKNKMKKSIAVLALVVSLVAFIAVGLALAKKTTPPLTCATEYFFVGHLGIVDAEGRLLCWEGPISGDIEGIIVWWMGPMSSTGQVSHVVERWEIWDGDGEVLLLAGDEKGTTTICHGKNTVWRANGIVTEASEEYENYIGSQTHNSGDATWVIPGVLPEHGTGKLRIAGSK